MNTAKYILFPAFCAISFCGMAQVQIIAKDTSKHTPVVMDTSKHAPVVVFIPPPPVPDTNIHVYEPTVVKNIVEKIDDYQRYMHGTSAGFRVQIDFSQERNSVNNTKSTFAIRYPSVPSYITYKQPYFRVSVGDFRTRLEAFCFLAKAKKDYPAAFVVADKITPPPLQ